MNTIFPEILELYNEPNAVARGRSFEVLIREIMPWDRRPPVVISLRTEQLDGVFQYRSALYLIESKAVEGPITPGSHDWEDFELKIRTRRRNVIGLFCSLFKVSKGTIDKANELNREGYTVILLHGDIWQQLHDARSDFAAYLDYMLFSARIKYKASSEKFSEFEKWYYDKKNINDAFANGAVKISSSFLSRFKHHRHDQVYVKRRIDSMIESIAGSMKPSALKKIESEPPKQIVIIRDMSGSGKTTLATNISLGNDYSFGIGSTAGGTEIDETLNKFLNEIQVPHFGIPQLLAVNKPLLVFIDSLDEVAEVHHNQKRAELRGLFRRVRELNDYALNHFGLKIYPVLLVFSVREEYWRGWEAAFEGRGDVIELKSQINSFTPDEFEIGLQKYSAAYYFRIVNNLSAASRDILSVPINLEMFSEANEYHGAIVVEDVWEGGILHKFFRKKEENSLKHYIEGFTHELFYSLLGELAFHAILTKSIFFSKDEFVATVIRIANGGAILPNSVLRLLVSEQIIFEDQGSQSGYRFRYMRFVEYFVALHIVELVKDAHDFKILEEYIHQIYDSNIASIHSILKNIRYITKTNYPDLELKIATYYENSNAYLSRYLPHLRALVARGQGIQSNDLKLLVAGNYAAEPEVAWESFFILSARSSVQPASVIFPSFKIAWQANDQRKIHRFKLIDKLSILGLLIHEEVVLELMADSLPRDWEVYFGFIVSKNLREPFLALWEEMRCQARFIEFTHRDEEDWSIAHRLLQIIRSGEKYIPGDVFNKGASEVQIVELRVDEVQMPVVSEATQSIINDFANSFCKSFELGTPISGYLTQAVSILQDHEREHFYKILFERTAQFSPSGKPFLYVLFELPEPRREVIRCITNLKIPFALAPQPPLSKSLIQLIFESEIYELSSVIEYLFRSGYTQNQYDNEFLMVLISDSNTDRMDLERAVVTMMCCNLGQPDQIAKFSKIDRVLYTLYAIKFNKIVGFGFTNFIQVVNNALEHYSGFFQLFLTALEVYGRFDEVKSRDSFIKKVDQAKLKGVGQSSEFNDIIKKLFPEII